MRFGSVCSGIEAASVAFKPLGWEAAWLAEVDVGASCVLNYHYGATAPIFPLDPEETGIGEKERKSRLNAIKSTERLPWGKSISNYGDMTRIKDLVLDRKAEAPDILCGGTPCQDFSLAGLRAGLKGARGQLTLAFVELADAIDEIRIEDGNDECVIFWENVPGVLSDKSNAFGNFLAALTGEVLPLEPPGGKWTDSGVVLGPKRAVAWRIGDAQYFGHAQRRRRVIVIASAMDGFDPGEILLEFDGVRRDIKPSRKARQDITHAIAPSLTGSGRGVERAGDPRGQDPVVASDRRRLGGITGVGHQEAWPAEIACTLDSSFGSKYGQDNQHVTQNCPLFVPAIKKIARKRAHGDYVIDELARTIKARDFKEATDLVIEPVPILEAGARTGKSTTDIRAGMGVGQPGDPMFTLQAGKQHAVCVTEPVTHTLTAEGFDASEDGTGRGTPIIVHGTQDPCVGDIAFALGRNDGQENVLLEPVAMAIRTAQTGANGHGCAFEHAHTLDGANGQAVSYNAGVRRLLPVECERLQGFPDGWTDVPVGNKPAADGPRYKQLGNSWAVKHIAWVGARLDRWLKMNRRDDDLIELLS